MTYKEFIDDILVTIGMGFDDALWYTDNILMNVLHCEKKLVTQSLAVDTGVASDGRSASRQLSTIVVPVTYNQTPSDLNWAYLYFDLPSEVYDLPHDKGINMVRYHRPSLPVGCRPSIASTPFTGTTLASLDSMYSHRHMAPSESRPYFARAKAGNADRVYLFGISPLITNVLVGLFSTPRYDMVDLDSDMQANPQQLFTLKEMVLDMAVWPMSIPQERLKNDGRDGEPGQVINPRRLQSINSPAVLPNTTEQ